MIDAINFVSNGKPFSGDYQEDSFAHFVDGIRACSNLNNLSSIIVDYDKRETIFVSDHMIYLDEAIYSDYKRTSANPYWSLLDEGVMEQLSHVQADYTKLKEMMLESEYNSHICVMDYPISIKGRKFYINSKFTPLVIRPDGVIRLGLFSFSPSNKKDISFMVITSSGKRWAYDFTKRSFVEFDLGMKFTVTERAVLQRAKKGMSNEEIANDLFLSLNTIKSHKMHIFKKLGVKTITEALVVLGNYQLL